MSDIIEDQKIHYIVKDYQRMYNGFHALVDENKELEKKVDKYEKRIANLESELAKKQQAEAKNKKLDGLVACLLSNSLAQVNALYNKAVQTEEQAERLSKGLEELNIELRK